MMVQAKVIQMFAPEYTPTWLMQPAALCAMVLPYAREYFERLYTEVSFIIII
jgi:hypothetical protein